MLRQAGGQPIARRQPTAEQPLLPLDVQWLATSFMRHTKFSLCHISRPRSNVKPSQFKSSVVICYIYLSLEQFPYACEGHVLFISRSVQSSLAFLLSMVPDSMRLVRWSQQEPTAQLGGVGQPAVSELVRYVCTLCAVQIALAPIQVLRFQRLCNLQVEDPLQTWPPNMAR
jgi:hypothetical protein